MRPYDPRGHFNVLALRSNGMPTSILRKEGATNTEFTTRTAAREWGERFVLANENDPTLEGILIVETVTYLPKKKVLQRAKEAAQR